MFVVASVGLGIAMVMVMISAPPDTHDLPVAAASNCQFVAGGNNSPGLWPMACLIS